MPNAGVFEKSVDYVGFVIAQATQGSARFGPTRETLIELGAIETQPIGHVQENPARQARNFPKPKRSRDSASNNREALRLQDRDGEEE